MNHTTTSRLRAAFCCLSLAFCGQAFAEPLPADRIANMVAQSEWVMEQGLCQVANDPNDYGSATLAVVLPRPIGVRRISRNTYNQFRNLGYEKAPSGRYAMSEFIEQTCGADALSDGCLAARSFWSQEPFHAPGNGVTVQAVK